MSYILKPAATLFVTAVIVIAALSVVFNYTYEPIQIQRQIRLEAAMRAVLPQAEEFSEMEIQRSGTMLAVFKGITNQDVVGYVVSLAPPGYSGNIFLMVGIHSADQRVSGMRIVQHTETPGLGALAVRPDFYRRFDNRPLIPMNVVRVSPGEHDIQTITASTITTRAITDAVNEAIAWYLAEGGGR